MADDVRPTPTQLENDLARVGLTPVNKREDGSPPDSTMPPAPEPGPEPKVVVVIPLGNRGE
jgi:hypothetical protein